MDQLGGNTGPGIIDELVYLDTGFGDIFIQLSGPVG